MILISWKNKNKGNTPDTEEPERLSRSVNSSMRTGNYNKNRAMRIMAISCAILMCTAIVLTSSQTAGKADAIVPIIIAVIVLVIALIISAMVIGYLLAQDHSSSNPALAGERQNEANNIEEYIASQYVSDMASLSMDSQTWEYANNYWERNAEIVAASLWNSTGTYNAEQIVDDSGLRLATTTIENNYALLMDYATTEYSNFPATEQNSSIFGSMDYGFAWDSGSISTSNQEIQANYGQAAYPVNTTSNEVYLDDTYGYDSQIWVYGGSSTITSLSNGNAYVLSNGENNLTDLNVPSGVYQLQTDRMYIGSIISPSMTDHSTSLVTGVAMTVGSSTAGAMLTSSGVEVYQGSSVTSSNSLDYEINADGTSYEVDMVKMLDADEVFQKSILRTLSATANAGETEWYIFDAAGRSSSLISPSSIMPSLENLNLTSQEQYEIYICALQQIGQYWQSSNSSLNSDEIYISPNSLQLYCYGNIYDADGNLLVKNAVFTPWCYLNDTALYTGNNTWDQPGYAMVWASGLSSMSAWNGTPSTDNMSLVSLSAGYALDLQDIKYDNGSVHSVTLQVEQLTRWTNLQTVPIQPLNDTMNNNQAWQTVGIVLGVVGAIILIVGAVSKKSLIMLFGLAILIIGIVIYMAATGLG